MPVGMSASQLGLNQSKNKLPYVSYKKLLLSSLVMVLTAGVLLGVLVVTGVISLSRFKSLDYTNSDGVHYRLDFYSQHTASKLQSGNNQLVSKVSLDDKLPLVLSISTTPLSGYTRLKDCASFKKVLDVQNKNLDQKISVCDFGVNARGQQADITYVAGFKVNEQAHVVTIGQDYSSVKLSSQSDAQQSLNKLGLGAYKDDVARIISSIKVVD